MMMFRRMAHRLLNDEPGADGTGDGHLPSGGDAVGSNNDARVALLNQIGLQSEVGRADELADVHDDDSTTPFEADAETVAHLSTDEPPAPQPLTEEPAPQPLPQMVKLKINGSEVEMPLEEALARAQKVSAADQYLEEAVRLRTAQAAPPPAPVAPGPTAAEVEAQSLAERRALARAIQMGTEEEAVAAIAKLQSSSERPTITMDTVSRTIDERLKFNTAIDWFNKEYSDLKSDPQLNRMVLEADAALLRQGDTRPYAERYKAVGDAVRSWKDNLIKTATKTTTTAPVASLEAKRAAKAAAPAAPVAANVRAAGAPQEEEDESPSQVIAAMAKARGGPQWARG